MSLARVGGLAHYDWVKKHESALRKMTIVNTPDHERGLKMLLTGRADYFLGYKSPVDFALKSSAIPGLQYQTLLRVPMHIVISKKTPNGQQLMKDLIGAFDRIGQEQRPNLDY